MTTSAMPSPAQLVKARIRVPQHVVYRSFPSETVVLNLQTGKYHGLNPTAGRMLEALQRAGTVSQAAALAAGGFGQSRVRTEQDMCNLCQAFLERGLIEIEANHGGPIG
jgi:hypothetical protein